MNWTPTTLGDVADFLSGGTPRKDRADYWDGDIPWVSAKDLKQPLIYDSELHLSSLGADNASQLVPADTVLFVVRGMSLANEFRVSLSKVPVCFNQDLKALRPRNGVSSKFLFYALSAQKDAIRQRAGEASHGTKKLDTDVVKRIPLKLPLTIEAQAEIADQAEQYDLLIANNRHRIELLERSARLLFEEWFVHLRYPGHEHDKIANGLPEGWSQKPLGEVVMNFDRKRKPLSVLEREKRPGKYPYYGAATVLDHIDGFLFDGRYLLVGEDGTVITTSGTPMLQLVQGQFWVNNHAHVLQGDKISTEFAYCFLSQYQISGHITGVAQPKITQANLNRIPVKIPTKRLAESFQLFASSIFDQVFLLKRQMEIAGKARDLLLPRLMDGRIAV